MKTTQTLEIPADGIEGLKKNWRQDMLAGFFVFLIALPLSLAIAHVSRFPAIAGVITAIVGGVVITILQGSDVTIKGPATGMIAVVIGSVIELGHQATLAVIVIAGVIQVLFGLFRAGKLGDFFPSSAVHGMLAAIGIMIATRQLHSLVGVEPVHEDAIDVILEIPHSIRLMNPYVALIGLISLVILFGMPLVKNKWVKKIPAPIVVLIVAISLGHYFELSESYGFIFNGVKHTNDPESVLVTIPEYILDGLETPKFSYILEDMATWKWIFMFALVGSLESLLSTKAVDILDPYKRKSNLNKDLFAVGVGNVICGFIGALPMISEIVRSSANINNGGRSRWSNFYHGLFLLCFVTLLPRIIREIPLAALAAMLIFTGYKLASPRVFIETYKIGKEQLIIFLTTLIVTLATDLLIGIFCGIIVKFIIHIIQGAPLRSLFLSRVEVNKSENNVYTLKVKDSAIFSNYLGFKRRLDSVPSGNKIVIDFSEAKLIDHTTMEHIHHYGEDYSRAGGTLSVSGLEKFRPLSKHPLSYRVVNKDGAEVQTPRVTQLKNYAKSIGFSYKDVYPFPHSNYGKFSTGNTSIKYEGNIISGKLGAHDYTVSDLSLVSGGTLKAQVSQVTVLSISNIHMGVPIFSLQKELLFDQLTDKKDIDFAEFPKFSKDYKLVGLSEESIRKFFGKALIEFFEQNEIYNVESLGAELLIYKPKQVLSVNDINNAIEYGKQLMSIMEKNINTSVLQ